MAEVGAGAGRKSSHHRGTCIGSGMALALALWMGTCTFTRGPCSLAALEGKPFEFSKPQLVVKVTPLTGVGCSGLSPSVAILCFPRGF